MVKSKFFLVIFFYLILINNTIGLENKIILKIDNKIITTLDINREMRYLVALNPYIQNIERNKLYNIAKNSLLKEKVKEIELLKNSKEINFQESYLDQFIENSYKKIGINNKEEFIEYLTKQNLLYKDIKEKIKIEIAWNRLIYLKYNSQLKIDKDNLKKQILSDTNKDQQSYFLQEILFETKKKSEIKDMYNKIIESIKDEGFEKTAIIFSISDTSKNGGSIGWIKKNSLNPKINKALEKINIGEFTEPIVIPGGFLILKLKDVKTEKNQISNDNLENELSKLIRQKTNEQLNQYSLIYYKKIEKNTPIHEL
tara:strand:- start:382 stop:1320 length:939 start_codon:yes stop_codon:yes gene_type:complete